MRYLENFNNKSWVKDIPENMSESFQLTVDTGHVNYRQERMETGNHRLLLKIWGSSHMDRAQTLQKNLSWYSTQTKKSTTVRGPSVIAQNFIPKE